MVGRFERETVVLILILAVLSSFIMYNLVFRKSSFPSASAVLTGGNIGVYWDANCTQTVTSIDWGNLTPGDTEEVVVFVRNEGNQTLDLSLTLQNWNPANASQYVIFSWNYMDSVIHAGDVLTVSQTLHVASPYAGDFLSVTFDTLFEGLDHLLADVNRDGIVDVRDINILANHLMETPASAGWNPDLDLNKDGIVNTKDINLAASEFDKTLQ